MGGKSDGATGGEIINNALDLASQRTSVTLGGGR